MGLNNSIVRAESLKSDNSLEEHVLAYRDSHNRISSPHLLPNSRDSNHQYRNIEVDPDAIQVIGDLELQNLPEAVNREILKNSGEIMYKEDLHPVDLQLIKDEHFVRSVAPRRAYVRYPLLDEDKKSLSDSKRNLSNKNFIVIDEEKRSLNGSKRNLNASKKYFFLPLEKSDVWNENSKNAYLDSKENLIRRHTGSKERLNVIKRGVNSVKGSKEYSETRPKRFFHPPSYVEMESEKQRKTTNCGDVARQHSTSTLSPSSESTTSPNDIIVTMPFDSIITSESGFAESPHSGSSPESPRKELLLPGNSIIQRNRKSYEHAQLQDVNKVISKTNSDCSSSDSDAKDNGLIDVVRKKSSTNTKQTISHTSV